MTTHRTGKYDYNALCDVCGFKKKASELIKRWDGLMVCDEDWEPRNILDFYRTRNDAHQLPFTRPDDASEFTWIPTLAGITGSSSVSATYSYSLVSNKLVFEIQIIPVTSITLAGASVSYTFPSIPGVSTLTWNGGTCMESKSGKYIGQLSLGLNKFNLPNCTTSDKLLIRGSFTLS
jgi:hypothetical protein